MTKAKKFETVNSLVFRFVNIHYRHSIRFRMISCLDLLQHSDLSLVRLVMFNVNVYVEACLREIFGILNYQTDVRTGKYL